MQEEKHEAEPDVFRLMEMAEEDDPSMMKDLQILSHAIKPKKTFGP